jgi:hypothetical protein
MRYARRDHLPGVSVLVDATTSDYMETPDSTETAPSTHAFPLDGWLERQQFGPGITILAGLVLGFLAFQGVSMVVLLGAIAVGDGFQSLVGMDPGTLVETYASEFLVANTVGQFVGLLGFGWLLAKFHTSEPAKMLRVRGTSLRLAGLSVLGLVALFPLVQWVGTLMEGLPWPESIRNFEQVQMDLLEQVLATDLGFFFTLFTMAVTPALCEELFFRGYIQRQSERLFRTWLPAVFFTGIVFGLYHMRLTQAVPLSMLGIYMAYVVWVSGSLVPGILVHLLNNGFAVSLGAYIAASETLSLQDIESLEIPPLVIILSAAAFALIIRTMHKQAPEQGGEATDE